MGGSQRATTHTDKARGFPFRIQTPNPSTAMWSPDPTLRSLESSRIEILPPPLNSPADLIRNRPRGLHMEERTTAGGRGHGAPKPLLWAGDRQRASESCHLYASVLPALGHRRETEGGRKRLASRTQMTRLRGACPKCYTCIHCLPSVLRASPVARSRDSFTSTFTAQE